jgi:hypothetical protein
LYNLQWPDSEVKVFTALSLAREKGLTDIVKLLQEKGARE